MLEDINSLRQLAGLVLDVDGALPVDSEGRIDAYKLMMQEGFFDEVMVYLCRSVRFDEGPTIEQIRAGDRSAFPYIAGWPDGPESRPVFWDRRVWVDPSSDEKFRLVAFATGSTKVISEEEFAKLDLEAGRQLPE